MVAGLFVGIIRMFLEWSIPSPACGSGEENQQYGVVKNVQYLHFAIILSLVTAIVNGVISYCTKPRTKAQVVYFEVLLSSSYA